MSLADDVYGWEVRELAISESLSLSRNTAKYGSSFRSHTWFLLLLLSFREPSVRVRTASARAVVKILGPFILAAL